MKNKEIIIVLGVIVVALVLVFAFNSGDKNESSKKVTDSNDVEAILANAQKESETVKSDEMKEKLDVIFNNNDSKLDWSNIPVHIVICDLRFMITI